MLASAADDIRLWDGDKFDNIVNHYRPNVQKVSSLAWNSSNTQLANTSPGGGTIGIAYLDSDQDPTDYPIVEEASCLCWHSSSRSVGLGCLDGNVRIYNLKSQTTKKTYPGHKTPINCITYNFNDTTIASASKSGEIILHNTVTDLMTKLMTTLKLQAIQGLQYSYYHHSTLASVSDDASLVLWDTNARRSVHQFTRSHKAPATDLTFSPSNDKLLMSCGLDKNIVLYDVLNKSLVRSMQVDSPLSSITMHPNGYQIASGTIKGQILLHDLRQGSTLQHSFTAHRSSVQCLRFQNRLIPKKPKNSSHSSSSRSVSHSTSAGDSQLNSEPSIKTPALSSNTPLSTLDQNRQLNGDKHSHQPQQPVKTSKSVSHIQDVIEEVSEPFSPRFDGSLPLNNHQTSTAAGSNHNSIFSPDVGGVGGDESQPSRRSIAASNHQSPLLHNGSNNSIHRPHMTDSVFSPDMPSDLQRRNQSSSQQHTPSHLALNDSGLPPRHHPSPNTSLLKYPQKSNSVATTTPVTRRELPPSPAVNGHVADSPSKSERRLGTKASPINRRSGSGNVHFTTEPTADVADGASGDVQLTNKVKYELKHQLKSELVSEIRDMIDVMKDEIKQSMMDHHFEMIKQFYLMQVHVESQTSAHSLNHDLLRENEELKAEIERLKRAY